MHFGESMAGNYMPLKPEKERSLLQGKGCGGLSLDLIILSILFLSLSQISCSLRLPQTRCKPALTAVILH